MFRPDHSGTGRGARGPAALRLNSVSLVDDVSSGPGGDHVRHRDPTVALDPAAHRHLGVDLYNSTWTLLEKANRTALETDELIDLALALRQGRRASEPGPRGVALLADVLGARPGEPALWHARGCVVIYEPTGIGDWDIASAY